MGNVIEILVQLALASDALGERTRATELLGRALVMAEDEGHVRVFLEATPALSCAAPWHRAGLTRVAARARRACRGKHALSSATPLVDELSERELDVLRLLGSELGGPAIARELSVSVNTVRTHTRHIYAKLGVTNRREAVREAARLGLLHRSAR